MCLSKIIEGGQKGRKENLGGCFRTCFRTAGSGCLSFLSSAGFCVFGELFMYILCVLIDWFVFELCSCKHSFHSSHRCLTNFQDYFPPWCSPRPAVLGFGGFSLICALCDRGCFVIVPKKSMPNPKEQRCSPLVYFPKLFILHTHKLDNKVHKWERPFCVYLSEPVLPHLI